jgi:ubiquinone/menaquinone biosynthesis C-methylase UbiE
MSLDKNHQHFFNHHANSWNSTDTRQKMESLEKIFQQIDPGVQEVVLDLGCGTGILVPILLNHTSESGKVIEFDFSLEMLKQNKYQCHLEDQRLVRLNGDAHYLPFVSERFTFLACFAVLPHLYRPVEVYRELFRVLRREGKLLILHLMGSEQLNHFHSQAGEEIKHDYLPPAKIVAGQIEAEGFDILQVQEREDLYLILARKQ